MQFWKISPSGNPTVLVPAEQAAPEHRAELAASILHPDHLGADQVGYYSLPTAGLPARLEMMGGEFCLNATRALAFLLAHLNCLGRTGQTIDISVSGLLRPAPCKVVGQTAWTALDFENLPSTRVLSSKTWLVRLPGICHILHLNPKPTEEVPGYCRNVLAAHGLDRENAVGFIWLDEQKLELTPLVWVRQTNSLIAESACGSGSLACALLLREREGLTGFDLKQPSGHSLSINFEQMGGGFRIWVGGPVNLVARGELFIQTDCSHEMCQLSDRA